MALAYRFPLRMRPLSRLPPHTSVARADPDQRGEMSGIGEGGHIPADLRKKDLNAAAIETRDDVQPLDLLLIPTGCATSLIAWKLKVYSTSIGYGSRTGPCPKVSPTR